jgi:hypothetical protein
MIKSETPHLIYHNFQTQFFFFFSLFISIFIATLSKFQSSPLICHSIRFDPCYFNYYFLFGIIYKIEIPIKFYSSFFFKFCPHSFGFNLFYLRYFLKIDFFSILSSLSFFSDQIWTSFFLLLLFFTLAKKF